MSNVMKPVGVQGTPPIFGLIKMAQSIANEDPLGTYQGLMTAKSGAAPTVQTVPSQNGSGGGASTQGTGSSPLANLIGLFSAGKSIAGSIGGNAGATSNDGNGQFNLGVNTNLPGAPAIEQSNYPGLGADMSLPGASNAGPAPTQSLGVDTSMPTTAIDRAIQAGGATPMAKIETGLQVLKDNPHLFDQDHYMSMAEALLRAKHFGYGGGLDSDSGTESDLA